mgnify:CR=1 FL=1
MLFDFEYNYRTDGDYKEKVKHVANNLHYYTTKAKSNQKYNSQKKKYLKELSQLVDYNLAPFLEHYFPAYPKGNPFSLKDFPFAYIFYAKLFYCTLTCRSGRQVSKTTNLCGRQIMELYTYPGFKITVITPHGDQINTYANKFKEMIESYRFHHQHRNYRQNLYYREFKNKSSIKLTNVLTSPSKVRGISTDAICFDEAQDFDPDLEEPVMQIQSASDIPYTIYAGTSLTLDTFLEHKFQDSSQAQWTMQCSSCGHWNDTTLDNDVVSMIKPKGLCCSKCGSELNVREGKWVHHFQEAEAAGNYGIHVPKIIAPSIVENPKKWNDIYVASKKSDQNEFLKEILGIPVEEGARELTEQNLIDICSLGDVDNVQQRVKDKKYKYVVSGLDWGGSEHVRSMKTILSYTAHVMLGITPDYNFDIVHMRTYGGMAYHSITEDIEKNHNSLLGYAAGADFGVGQGYNMLLREKLPVDRYWMFSLQGPKAPDVHVMKDSRYNHLGLNKTEAITRIFEAIKSHRIRCYNYMQAKHYLEQCLNCIRSPHETPTGQTTLIYHRPPNKPDDILQALNFAYHIAMIIIGEPIFDDKAMKRHVEQILLGKLNASNVAQHHAMKPIIG